VGSQLGVTVALAFTLFYAQQLTLRIDVGYLECHHLGNAQAGSIGHHESGPVAEAGDVLEEELRSMFQALDRAGNPNIKQSSPGVASKAKCSGKRSALRGITGISVMLRSNGSPMV
jgi:hypothetical protein